MRQLYTSPHQPNIDRLVALLSEHDITCSVQNVSRWNKPGYQRFSYIQQRESRDQWPQVWVTHADDYTRARELLKQIGIEPVIRHAEALAEARNPSPLARRRSVVTRVRRIVLLAVGGAMVILMLRYMNVL
ncbi:putative signal transducing protein [Dyella sp.]|jgi:hypothetical protein|uniref:putative signal transducing protein n=1 Tax=Dyella sp. TaxID=1869338 RepID=UPI002D76A9CE|nr:DUF2007 domain-containing protein [Dyella sp.]HET6432217.1 DUF2007 domain-containing protein [Dyella sp.]